MNEPKPMNIMQWVDAFATCAIEGNKVAIEMIDLWNKGDKREFTRRLIRDGWLDNTEVLDND